MEYLNKREVENARTGTTERQMDRFRRAEEILTRSRPGPHEFSSYVGPLVLQAASVEAMIHADLLKRH